MQQSCIPASSLAAKVNRSFLLPSRCPCSALSLPWDLPGGCLRERVRLASQGFHLVIPPLGIHATTLAAPSEAPCPLVRLPACILTHQRRLPIVISTFPLPRPPPPPDRFSNVCAPTSQFFPFFAQSLLCSLCSRTLSHHHHPLLLAATHGLFDSVCISNCVIKESRQPPRSVEMAAGAICGARLMRQRGRGGSEGGCEGGA